MGGKVMKHRKGLIALLAVCFLAGVLYGGNYRLDVTDYTLTSAKLPEAFDGCRIVQLSDLHAMEFGRGNRRLVRLVAEQSPDLIVLTGDFIEQASDIPVTARLVEELCRLAPVYACSGNHDWASGAALELRDAIEQAGGVYLGNEYTFFSRGDDRLLIAGVEDPNSYADLVPPDDFLSPITEQYPDTFTILLGHRNDWPEQYPDLAADLIFSGHGHGGVIRLPGVGGLLGTDHRFFPEYDAGLYPARHYMMVVSRGLGSFSWIPRIGNPAEVLCLTLRHGPAEK